MKKGVKLDISWRMWSLIVGFFILVGFVGLSLAVSPNIQGHPDQAVPAGAIMAFNSVTCPDGWVPANGTNSPDLRGVFVRGLNNGRATTTGDTNASRTLGSYQSDLVGMHTHGYTSPLEGTSGTGGVGGGDAKNFPTADGGTTAYNLGAETRPRNVALLYCMKSAYS